MLTPLLLVAFIVAALTILAQLALWIEAALRFFLAPPRLERLRPTWHRRMVRAQLAVMASVYTLALVAFLWWRSG